MTLTLNDMRHSVQDFALEMEKTLRNNDHKIGWRACPRRQLLSMLKKEVEELEAALIDGDELSILAESVDVANFAHMLWDNVDYLQKQRMV